MRKIQIAKGVLNMVQAGLKYKISGNVEPFSAAIDVTIACNLRCTHCYFYRDEPEKFAWNRNEQITDDHWISRVKKLKEDHPHIAHVTWVGGEPLMKKNRLKQGIDYFPLNWVVTNGVIPIPDDWNNNTTFVVSVDGSEKYNDAIRGSGVFRKIIDNVKRTDARVYAHSVITRSNKIGVEELVDQLYDSKIRGIRFSFYTPAYGVDDPLWLPPKERDSVVGELHSLRDQYGKFIWMTSTEIEALRPDKQSEVFADKCGLKKGFNVSISYDGSVKKPCVMGPDADCYRCGCTIPAMTYAILGKKSIPTLLSVLKSFV